MLRVVLLSVTFVFVFAACGSGVNETHALSGWDRPWHDAEGSIVLERVVSTVQGPEHCDWQSTVLLYLGWPLGTHSKSADDARQYVRDPDGVFSARTVIPFEPDVRLPVGARDTGYHLGDLALWVAHDAGKAVYIVRGSHVERWPRARPPITCE
jgi:hypothetical protein